MLTEGVNFVIMMRVYRIFNDNKMQPKASFRRPSIMIIRIYRIFREGDRHADLRI